MEYLINQEQTVAATELLGEGLTPEALEEEIERLRTNFHRIQFGQTIDEINLTILAQRAYLLVTLVTGNHSYSPELVSKVSSVAAVVFEYMSGMNILSIQERLNYALNAILFYSQGEQEAQSATLARRMRDSELMRELSSDDHIIAAWRFLFLFLGREFKDFLKWGKDLSENYFRELSVSLEDDSLFWTDLLRGCLDTANYMVWGLQRSHLEYFDKAINQAKVWGDSRLTWLGFMVKEVAEQMTRKSIRSKLIEIGIPGWASETITMDSLVEMWLPHRDALRETAELEKGILSDEAKISLVNMPTSAGKSLVAEIAILFELTKDPNCKAIWVVPSRALVFEVQSRLSAHLRRIGIIVSSIPGGIEADPDDTDTLANARVFVLTPEKLDGLLRRHPMLANSVNIVVVDEIQKIGEGTRGWLFETVIAWLLLISEYNDNLRLIFMSAVLPNRTDFEVWLGQQSPRFISKWASWRPTRLALFLTSGVGIEPWTTKLIQRRSQETIVTHTDLRRPRLFDVPMFLLNIIYSEMKQSGSTLIFFYTKDDVNQFATQLSQVITESDPIPDMYEALAVKFAAVYSQDHPFTIALRRGIGIDHGDIPLWLRHLVERAFRNRDLPILVANQAILEGVNFPIENIIIGSLGSREGPNFRFRLSPLDYSNLVGRVGRAMVDTEGNCFLVWNWFYDRATTDGPSWDIYSSAVPTIEDIGSILTTDESEMINALQRLTSSLEGIDESAFDGFTVPWRDVLERLHSSALAILEHYGSEDYTRLLQWIQKTFAWQKLGGTAREALSHYTEYTWRGVQTADRALYRLASLSSLSVRSASEVQRISQQIIDNWVENDEHSFETIFTREAFNAIVNLRECWRRRPVTYSGRYVPNIDHYEATSAWVNGEEWTDVANIICANSMRFVERTRTSIVATYVSQMFEYRLPWVLGAVAVAVKEMDGPEKLCKFLDDLPAYVRYGVSVKEAVTISKLCRVERGTVLILAKKYLEQGEDQRELKDWLLSISLDVLKQWLPSEPELLLKDLHKNLHTIRERDWTLRRQKIVTTVLAGWTNYQWPLVNQRIQSNIPIRFALRPEPENPYDPFAVAIDAHWSNTQAHIGYIPASHAEEVTELINWGRDIGVTVNIIDPSSHPQIILTLNEVD